MQVCSTKYYDLTCSIVHMIVVNLDPFNKQILLIYRVKWCGENTQTFFMYPISYVMASENNLDESTKKVKTFACLDHTVANFIFRYYLVHQYLKLYLQ